MKLNLLFLFPALVLTGCISQQHYSESNMKLLASLYSFEPIKGHVKEMHFVVTDQAGKTFQDVNARFDANGCVTHLEVTGKPAGIVSLSREGNTLAGHDDGKKITFESGKNCMISGKLSDGKTLATYSWDSDGALVAIDNKDIDKDYRFYTTPDGKESTDEVLISGVVVDKTQSAYPDPVGRPLDYVAKATGTLLGENTVSMACQYENQTPTRCKATYHFGTDNFSTALHVRINTTFY